MDKSITKMIFLPKKGRKIKWIPISVRVVTLKFRIIHKFVQLVQEKEALHHLQNIVLHVNR